MTTKSVRLESFKLRATVRIGFCALLAAAILLPYASINWHKTHSLAELRQTIKFTRDRIVDKLMSPQGQLVLFNADRAVEAPTPLRPVVLPYDNLQTDSPEIVQDELRAVGCPIEFRKSTNEPTAQGSVCVGVSKKDAKRVQGRIFVSGNFVSSRLVPHAFTNQAARDADRPVALKLQDSHRILLELSDGQHKLAWVLPVQIRVDPKTRQVIPGLGMTAYKLDANGIPETQSDFSGAWLEEGPCMPPATSEATCPRTTLFSIAIPRNKWDFGPEVSPRDLTLRFAVLGPAIGSAPNIILDSKSGDTAFSPFVRNELLANLAPGDSVAVVRTASGGGSDNEVLFRVQQPAQAASGTFGGFGQRVLDWMPTAEVASDDMDASNRFVVRGVNFGLIHRVSQQGYDVELVQSSARMAAYAILMIFAILVVWLTIELRIVRRVLILTRRTRQMSKAAKTHGDLEQFDFAQLRGTDEIGVLAAGLDDLLKRIAGDMRREALRVESETSMLRAIGHEIRSPLQSLSAILGDSEQGKAYVRRMLRAVDALYGSASPSDGIENAEVSLEEMDLASFITSVANNAHHAGIKDVVFDGPAQGVLVRCDSSALEDILDHILNNADRYRPDGTPITIRLETQKDAQALTIHNSGPHIQADLIGRIFDYGVSDRPGSQDGNSGQGLFVAKTYLAKMGLTISAFNVDGGVEFQILFPVGDLAGRGS